MQSAYDPGRHNRRCNPLRPRIDPLDLCNIRPVVRPEFHSAPPERIVIILAPYSPVQPAVVILALPRTVGDEGRVVRGRQKRGPGLQLCLCDDYKISGTGGEVYGGQGGGVVIHEGVTEVHSCCVCVLSTKCDGSATYSAHVTKARHPSG